MCHAINAVVCIKIIVKKSLWRIKIYKIDLEREGYYVAFTFKFQGCRIKYAGKELFQIGFGYTLTVVVVTILIASM